jgi:hypothetical protein
MTQKPLLWVEVGAHAVTTMLLVSGRWPKSSASGVVALRSPEMRSLAGAVSRVLRKLAIAHLPPKGLN